MINPGTARLSRASLIVGLAALMLSQPLQARQTLDQGILAGLDALCPALTFEELFELPFDEFFEFGNLGPNLQQFCEFRRVFLVQPGDPGAAGIATRRTGDQDAVDRAIEERLEERREEDSQLLEDSRTGVFFSWEYEDLEKEVTRFEPGANTTVKSGLIGVDFRARPNLWLGALVGVIRTDGKFSGDAGKFTAQAEHYTLFASYDGAVAVDATIERVNHRFETVRRSAFRDPKSFSPLFEDRLAPSTSRARGFNASLVMSRAFNRGRATFTPRLEFELRDLKFRQFSERGNAALRLRYPQRTEVSRTSTLGLTSQIALGQDWGVLVPQLDVEWVHEFALNARNVRAHFAEDLNPEPVFVTYSTEAPDRDVFKVKASLTAVLHGGAQAFISYSTLQGHDYFDESIVTIGARLEF